MALGVWLSANGGHMTLSLSLWAYCFVHKALGVLLWAYAYRVKQSHTTSIILVLPCYITL